MSGSDLDNVKWTYFRTNKNLVIVLGPNFNTLKNVTHCTNLSLKLLNICDQQQRTV